MISSLFSAIASAFDSIACIFSPRRKLRATPGADTYEYFKSKGREVEVNKGTNIKTSVSYSENDEVIYSGSPKDAPPEIRKKIRELRKNTKDLTKMPNMDDLFADFDEDEAFGDIK